MLFYFEALHYLVEKRKSLLVGVWLVFGFPWTMCNWQHHYFENQYYISFHPPFSSCFILFYFENVYNINFSLKKEKKINL